MFQFTTTNVINSDKDLTTGKPLWTLGQDKDGNKTLHIKRVNEFNAINVKAIYKAEAHDGENAKVTINFNGLTINKGDQCKLSIYVGLTLGSNDSRYSNDYSYKGKPFTVDFIWKTDAADTVKKLVNDINKYELFTYGDKLLKVSYQGTFLTIEATDEFQRFYKLSIDKFDPEPHQGLGEYTEVKNIENITEVDSASDLTGAVEGIFKGIEGFGTYTFIRNNLRLSTEMRTRAFGINQDENPIPGAKYNQFTLHYCVNRGILGTNAVGDVVKSLTTHVFYVKLDLSSAFETALTSIAPTGGIIKVPEVPEVTE